jgi:4-amino-4-deoxy-L-arabinose transferase-like glycosyltransferase
MFDGHLYMLVARTMPLPYAGAHEIFPLIPYPAYITCWFPGYPTLIATFHWIVGDLRLAAMLAPLATGLVTTLIVRRIAAIVGERPVLTGLVFAVCPIGWVLSSSLALCDSLFAALTAAMVLAVLRKRIWMAVGFAGAALLTQKAGVLAPPLGAVLVFRNLYSRRDWLRASRFLLAFAALAGLQLYLWWLFGDPLINFKTAESLFGFSDGRLGLTWPGIPFVEGFLNPHPITVGKRLTTAATLAFYLLAAGIAAVKLVRHREHRFRYFALLVWIMYPLLFFGSLNTPWPYMTLWRYMTISAPAAVCVYCALWPRRQLKGLTALAGVVILTIISLAGVVREVNAAAAFMDLVYPRAYFEAFNKQVVEPADR